jgi:hypothetical protein
MTIRELSATLVERSKIAERERLEYFAGKRDAYLDAAAAITALLAYQNVNVSNAIE